MSMLLRYDQWVFLGRDHGRVQAYKPFVHGMKLLELLKQRRAQSTVTGSSSRSYVWPVDPVAHEVKA